MARVAVPLLWRSGGCIPLVLSRASLHLLPAAGGAGGAPQKPPAQGSFHALAPLGLSAGARAFGPPEGAGIRVHLTSRHQCPRVGDVRLRHARPVPDARSSGQLTAKSSCVATPAGSGRLWVLPPPFKAQRPLVVATEPSASPAPRLPPQQPECWQRPRRSLRAPCPTTRVWWGQMYACRAPGQLGPGRSASGGEAGGLGRGLGRGISSVAAPGLAQEEDEVTWVEHARLQHKEEAHDGHCAAGVPASADGDWGGAGAIQKAPPARPFPALSPVLSPSGLPREHIERRAAAAQAADALMQCLWRVEGRLGRSRTWGTGDGSPCVDKMAHALQQEWETEQQSEHWLRGGGFRSMVVHTVLTRLQHEERLGSAVAKGLLHWAGKWQDVSLDLVLSTTLFLILGRRGDAPGLVQAVRELDQAGLALDDGALCALSSAYQALGMKSEAVAVLKSPQTFLRHLGVSHRGPQGLTQGDARVHKIAPAGVFSACKLMDLYIQQRQFQHAWRVFRRVQASGAEEDEALCRTAIVALGGLGHTRRAEGLFRKMQAKWGQLQVRTMNVMMHVYSQAGEWRRVADLYRQLQHGGGVPNAWTYCILISAMGRSGKAQLAASFFREMQAQGLEPGRAEWQALIQAHARNGDVVRAKASLRAMLRAGFAFSMPAGNALLTAYCMAGMVKEARELARVMDSKGYTPLVEVPGTQWGRPSRLHFRRWSLGHQWPLESEAEANGPSTSPSATP